VTLADWLAGIAAALTALGGIFLVVRELNRRERRSADKQIDTLTKQVHVLREDSLAYHSWAYDLAERMTDAGMDVPPAPRPSTLAEPNDEPKMRRLLRRDEEER
jgi:hypothetical protein